MLDYPFKICRDTFLEFVQGFEYDRNNCPLYTFYCKTVNDARDGIVYLLSLSGKQKSSRTFTDCIEEFFAHFLLAAINRKI